MAEKTKIDELLEKTLEHLGKMDARLDAMEEEKKAAAKASKDAEEKEEKEKADKAKKDAEEKAEKEKMDARAKMDAEAVKRFDRQDGEMPEAFKKRADAEESKLCDEFEKEGESKEVAADRAKKARKDAEEMMDKKDAEEKMKEDAKKADAAAALSGATAEAVIALQAKIKELTELVPRSVTDQDYGALLEAQARADGFYGQHGLQAPRPLNGETVPAYRKRMARGLQAHSARWKEADLLKLDDAAFGVVEEQIYADSAVAAANPTDLPDGTLRSVTRIGPTGHRVTEFYGQPKAWMDKFAGPVRQSVKKFMTGAA